MVVVIGCGGGGGTGGGGPTTTTTTTTGGSSGPTAPTVNLDTDSTILYLLLTGANRRAGGIGDQFVELRNITVQNDVFDFAKKAGQGVGPARLNGYSIHDASFSYTIPFGQNFKTFSEYPMEISGMKEQTGPDPGDITDLFTIPEFINPPFNLNMVLLRGREITIQINLDESIVFYDVFSNPKFNFDRAGFEDENYDPIDGAINSFLSDYISFDIANMSPADTPNLVSGAEADKVLFSGDAIAMASGFDTEDSFEVLNPVFLDQGRIKDLFPPDFPGTYSVFEDDPRDLIPPIAKLIALQGIWRNYNEVLGDVGTNVGNEAMIAFPNSRQDTESMTVVYFKRDAFNNIVALWQGVIRLSGPQANSIVISPIHDLPSGILAGEARGTLTNFVFLNGEVVKGEFTFNSGPGLPGFPFSLQGEFAVFIK